MKRTLLQQVRVLDPVSGTDRIADISIADRTIKAIEAQIPAPGSEIETDEETDEETNIETIDCRGLVLGPGLVDLYGHGGEPGFEERETLASLMQAAAAGGFTRIAILPDTKPPLDNPGSLAWLRSRLDRLQIDFPNSTAPPQLYFWGALTKDIQGEQMTEFAELANSGIVGFADSLPLENLALLRRILEYLQPLKLPLAIWPKWSSLAGKSAVREGRASIRLGLPGAPASAETSALAAILEIARATGTPVHIMRVSTARSLELIEEAKSRGLPVTASTTWMHLLLNTEDIDGQNIQAQNIQAQNIQALSENTPDSRESNFNFSFPIPYDPSLRLDPPLGNPEDQTALIRGVREGIIDAIAIDHSPYLYEEKNVAFAEAPPGAIGLELALSLLWQNLVKNERLSALELWRALSSKPALCLNLEPVSLSVGSPAELTLFDPEETWQANEHILKSRSANTPWLGQQIIGRVVRTF